MRALSVAVLRTATGVGFRAAFPAGRGVRPASEVNLSRPERAASALLGGVLLVRGLTRRSVGGAGIWVLGGILLYRGISGHSRLYEALGVNTAGVARREPGASEAAIEVRRSITIGRPADELYRFWREPGNLSRIVAPIGEVAPAGDGRTHWRVHVPLGRSLEWDARVMEDRPGELLRWESLEGADLPNEGSVSFRAAPRDWGTEVMLRFRFDPPGGVLGKAASERLSVVPGALAEKALRRFKSLVETGEIPTTERNPSARAGRGSD